MLEVNNYQIKLGVNKTNIVISDTDTDDSQDDNKNKKSGNATVKECNIYAFMWMDVVV